jgi:hypothetical protein
MVVLLSLFIWTVGARLQGITGGHYAGSVVERIITKWHSAGVPSWIFANVVFHNPMTLPAFLLGALLLATRRLLRIEMSVYDLIPFISGVSYLLVLMVVYLSTSVDVVWHMGCSAGRTGLVAAMLLMASNLHFMLKARL